MAFVAAALPTRARPAAAATVTMRRKGAQKRPGPSRTPAEKRARMEEIARGYGVAKPRVAEGMDAKYNKPAKSDDAPSPTVYQTLARVFGVEALDKAERIVLVALGVFLVAFLAGGIAISSEAFFKATGKDISDSLDATLANVEQVFTPALVVFLSLSSLFGLYKQSQLTSGATAYVEEPKDGDDQRGS